jgi:uncharacterized protein (TIGR03000 family)
LYIDDQLKKGASESRSFDTPVLQPGETYFYDVRVERLRDGKTVTESKRLIVRAGQETHVRFGQKDVVTAMRAEE